MDAEKVILTFLLATISLPCLQSSEFYLANVGPAPLRFASPPSKGYVWPIGLNPLPSATNSAAAVTDSVPVTSTNLVLTSSSPPAQTNNSAIPSPQTLASGSPTLWQIQPGTDGNLLSASNLLVLTPQMLADYFKANLDSLTRSATNGPAGPDLPFNPPTPKPPSSEAIYRTQ
jgi:hypothetical protein